MQKLGSAFGLVKASRELHNNLSQVRAYFEENAQTLGLLLNKIKAAKSPKQAKKRKKRRGTTFGHSNSGSSISENSTDNFIGALNKLAKSVNRFYSGTCLVWVGMDITFLTSSELSWISMITTMKKGTRRYKSLR